MRVNLRSTSPGESGSDELGSTTRIDGLVLRVTGDSLTISRSAAESDLAPADVSSDVVAIPLADVTGIEEPKLDGARTAVLVLGGAGVIALAMVLVANTSSSGTVGGGGGSSPPPSIGVHIHIP